MKLFLWNSTVRPFNSIVIPLLWNYSLELLLKPSSFSLSFSVCYEPTVCGLSRDGNENFTNFHYLVNKNNRFARSARAFFKFLSISLPSSENNRELKDLRRLRPQRRHKTMISLVKRA